MKSKLNQRILAMTAGMISILGFTSVTAFAQGTAFTYQGRLNSGASGANGSYDLRFAIYDALTLGTQQGTILTNSAAAVSNGLFTVTMDFGNQFPGASRWLEIGVRTNGVGAFTTLAPRQPLTPTPYAVYAGSAATAISAGSAGSVSAANITGTVSDSRLSSKVALRAGGNAFTGNQSITGGGLQMLGSGTDDAALLTVGNSDFSHLLALFPGRLNAPNPFILWKDGDPLRFATDKSGFSELMRVTSSGNVGIGTTTPSNKLEVLGMVKATAFSGDGANLTNVNSTTLNGLTSTGFWKTNGNTGANPTNGAFLGTADNLPVEFRVHGSRALRLEPTTNLDTVNVIGGSARNFVDPGTVGATIGGGGGSNANLGSSTNSVGADFSTVSGGAQNTIQSNAYAATIGGGYQNAIEPNAFGAAIGGGYNKIQPGANSATIGGGSQNTIQSNAYYATISGGDLNMIQTNDVYSTIGGGHQNTIQVNISAATIGGGLGNNIQIDADYAIISGGVGNTIQPGARYATIPGGWQNSAASYAFAAGRRAKANHAGAFVWADSADADFVSTGINQFLIRASGGVGINNNNPNGAALAVSGDVTVEGVIYANGLSAASVTTPQVETPEVVTPKISTAGNVPLEFYVNGQRAFRLEPDTFANTVNMIGGSPFNFVASGVQGATIGGGGGTVHGIGIIHHYTNSVEDSYGTVSGGRQNSIQPAATFATIGGGVDNTIQGYMGTIGGGGYNTASGSYATVPGGMFNFAGGQSSFAAGQYAQALHDGSFVWADATEAGFASTANNQFCIRAGGGIQLDPQTSQFFGSQTRQMLNLYGTTYGLGVQADTLYFRCANSDANSGFIWYKGGVHNDNYVGSGGAGGGTEMMHLVGGGLYVNGTIVLTSDRNVKENFAPVQPLDVLEKVVSLPLSSWNYKADTATRHVGPMAQDFYAAFNVGPDDKHIATVDADGVALAAIQGLNQKLEEQRAENADLKHQLAELKQLVQTLVPKH